MTKDSLLAKLDFFKKVSLFHDLNDDQIKKIISIMKTRGVKQGEIVCQENAHGDSLFILLKGEVEITKRLLLPLVQDPALKQEKSLVILSEKQYPFFGEMALFEDTPVRSASITALKSCTLIVIEKSDLLNILRKDPKIGSIIYKNIAAELTHRLVKANKDILKLTTAFSLAIEGE